MAALPTAPTAPARRGRIHHNEGRRFPGVSLTLAAGQLAALDDMGAALAATRSELVRAAVDEFLARYGAAAVSGGEGATT